jgi:hypothetical protein
MFRYARSGCRTPPPRILHLLRSTLPTLIVRRDSRALVRVPTEIRGEYFLCLLSSPTDVSPNLLA